MEYKASLDNIAKILTVGVFVLFVVIGWQSAKSLLSGDNDTFAVVMHSGVVVMLIVILLFCWLYAPRCYVLDNDTLVVNRAIGNVKFKIDAITQVRVLTDGELN